MNFGEAIKSCLNQYATFRGRAARSEFWFFALFVMLSAAAAAIIDRVLGTGFHTVNPMTGVPMSMGYGYVYTLVALGFFCLTCRSWCGGCMTPDVRAGGTGSSCPAGGAIILLVWFCSRGTEGTNDYGIDPLSGGVARTFT